MNQEAIFDRLCSVCRTVVSNIRVEKTSSGDDSYWRSLESTDDAHSNHHDNILDLQRAAHNGCHICNLYQHVEKLQNDFEQQGVDPLPQFSIELDERESTLCLRNPVLPSCRVELRIFISNKTYPIWLEARRNSSFNTRSDAGLDQMRTWLQKCLASHDACKRGSETNLSRKLPSSLIDVGPLEREPYIKLIETSGLPIESQYITLSHCWGGWCSTRLTHETSAGFFRRIKASDLPKTFLETVMLVRDLGIRYL